MIPRLLYWDNNVERQSNQKSKSTVAIPCYCCALVLSHSCIPSRSLPSFVYLASKGGKQVLHAYFRLFTLIWRWLSSKTAQCFLSGIEDQSSGTQQSLRKVSNGFVELHQLHQHSRMHIAGMGEESSSSTLLTQVLCRTGKMVMLFLEKPWKQ